MTEKSYYWSDNSTGDGSLSTYDNDEFSDIWRKLFQTDRTLQGYVEDYESELAVTNPSGSTIRVATGAALVDGKFYEADAVVDNTVATPSALTRVDRIVLRKSWAAQTVRVAVITGVEGAGVPALTQTDGVTWEIPLAQISITTGGVITVTDERSPCRTPLADVSVSGYTLIETITGDGSAATIDFQNIPQTYTHLILIGQGRMDGAILEADLQVRFNNDSGVNYDNQILRGDNTTDSATASTGDAEAYIGQIVAGSGTANHASMLNMHIANYANSFSKSSLSQAGHIPNLTVADFSIVHAAVQWNDVSAITRITLLSTTASSGNFASGSTYSLYGLL